MNQEGVKLLFPEELPLPSQIESRYPPRNLKEGAFVTRIAPSPTGFMHIGSLYAALISERQAHQSHGVFFLRIEDTDKKREVEGAIKLITSSLERYGIRVDEGENSDGVEAGAYGPYKQSNRVLIYKAYAKLLIERGLAYPCFDTPEELDLMRQLQENQGVRPGYYKQWATWRLKDDEQVIQALREKKKFVIRFRSPGDYNKKINAPDVIRGTRQLPENDQDIVLLKSDGLPTYHLAHIVDDHLMGTTHVLRGDEWFSSLPLHLQLFETLGWKPPFYGHISPIQKMDGASRRKLSKRKDPEANTEFYDQLGYPEEAIIEYLLNLANSNFEDWRKQNAHLNNRNFSLSLGRLPKSAGALFDFVKLENISKEVIANFSANDVFNKTITWAKKYHMEFAKTMEKQANYAQRIFSIEREGQKARKDFSKWSDIPGKIEYFFDQNFTITPEIIKQQLKKIAPEDIVSIVQDFLGSYNLSDSKDVWFEKIKKIAHRHGYATSTKEFDKTPHLFKGSMSDVAVIFRILLTGGTETPDLYAVMQAMGSERVRRRVAVVL